MRFQNQCSISNCGIDLVENTGPFFTFTKSKPIPGILLDEPKHDEKVEEEDEEDKEEENENKEGDLKKEFKEPVSEYTPPDPDHSCVVRFFQIIDRIIIIMKTLMTSLETQRCPDY